MFIVTLSAHHRVKQYFCQHLWELAPHMGENSLGEPVISVLEEIRATREIRDVPWDEIEFYPPSHIFNSHPNIHT
jgi:hypothetical protein